jgi:hypothetical protein
MDYKTFDEDGFRALLQDESYVFDKEVYKYVSVYPETTRLFLRKYGISDDEAIILFQMSPTTAQVYIEEKFNINFVDNGKPCGIAMCHTIVEGCEKYFYDDKKCYGLTPLYVAVERCNRVNGKSSPYRVLITMLLDRGANPNLATRQNETPLMIAMKSKDLTIIQELLHAGADPHQENYRGETAIFYARDKEQLLLLLDRCPQIDINHRDSDHYNVLFYSSITGHARKQRLLKTFLERGANINALNMLDETPLFETTNDLETMKFLIKNGCDPHIRNEGGDTVLSIHTLQTDEWMFNVRRRIKISKEMRAYLLSLGVSDEQKPLHREEERIRGSSRE